MAPASTLFIYYAHRYEQAAQFVEYCCSISIFTVVNFSTELSGVLDRVLLIYLNALLGQ